jgi:hypothetical protein
MTTLASSLVILISVLAPLALGSNRPLLWAINAVLVALVLLLTALGMLTTGSKREPLRLGQLAVPLTALCIVLIWLGVQLLPGGLGLAHPAWGLAGETLGSQISSTISINPQETQWSMLKWLTAGGLFLAVYCLARDRQQANLLLNGVIAAIAVNAVYGLVRTAFHVDRIFWFKHFQPDVLSGGFVNGNSAAMHLGMGLIAVFALIAHRIHRVRRETEQLSSRGTLRTYADAINGRIGLYVVLFVLFIICQILTGSRAGTVFTFAGLLVCLLLFAGRSRRMGMGGGTFVSLALMLVIATVVLLELSGARFVDQIARQGLEDSSRMEVYAQSLSAIRDYLLVGSGGGTFQDVFPIYRSDISRASVWDKAHNDYAELFIGLGVPVALIALGGVIAIVARCVRGVFKRRRDYIYSFIAVSASSYVALHSFFDFGIQMQANALIFAVILGVGMAQSVSSKQ